jgi:hypothetical protein
MIPGMDFVRGWPLFKSALTHAEGVCWGRRLIACCSPLRVLFGLVCVSSFAQPLFPPQCNVVLLSGLPGDVESENAYREQMGAWLELVHGAGPALEVFVLCDNPDGVKAQEGLKVNLLKADRSSFLGLSQTLDGKTNPLVVVAWGHGGRQGSTPVFHVRGPRLTASDFSGLAGKVSAGDSRWVLFFRGSGTFARGLTGEHRRILSSEAETMFNSDPVGMALLLNQSREAAAVSFEVLAERVGRSIADWYEERRLARTEEPTLWLAGAKPRPLAGGRDGEPVAVESANHKGDIVAPVQPAGTNQLLAEPLKGVQMSRELPPIWKEIHKIEAVDFPDADGVILRQRTTCTLGSSPALVKEHEEFLQVLTVEGKHFGDFDISFWPPDEEVDFQDCEVLLPDSQLARLTAEAINESHEQVVGDYRGPRRKFFSLPGVVPGAVLHVKYRTQWKKFPLPQISMELPLVQEVPALDATVQINLPKETPFHFGFEGVSAPDPSTQQTAYSTSYTWHFDKLTATQREPLVAPRQRGRLLFSTFTDWTAFGEWYARISKLTDEVTPEIAAKARELVEGAVDERAKVLALFNYVTALRYVAIPLGVNSFRPHAASNVLRNQFGDCKDKANLLNAMLHSLDIPANLVLVPRFSQAHEAIPGLAFNHAISKITLGEEFLWADTTDDICRFGLLPPGDPGRKVLVIDGKSTTLTRLPEPEAKDHQLKIQGRLDLAAEDGSVGIHLTATGIGYPDYSLREAARELKERRGAIPLLSSRFRPVEGAFALEKQTATAVSALDEDFVWRAEGNCLGLLTKADGKLLLRMPNWLPKEWDAALHRRNSPLFLNQGYPLTLDETFELTMQSKVPDLILPKVAENNEEPLRWRVEWARISDDKLVSKLHTELVRGELSAAQTPIFQKQLRGLLTALGESVVVKVPPAVSKQ